MKFKFYSDDRHGWLAVKRKLIIELGLNTEISKYSYEKGKTVYVEEDGDCKKFIAAYGAKFGSKPEIVEIYHGGSSPIRSYKAYKPDFMTLVLG